jgi:7-cyano-7-deazaguanine tRNA-ribosyltransferase
MDFYVSWSHSDPLYQLYDRQCSMLISIVNVTNIWHLGRFPTLPYQVMLDSGSYSYIANQLPLPTPREVFHRQLAIVANTDVPAIICAVDKPILERSLSLTERNQAIDKTIANAWQLKMLMAEYYKCCALDKHLNRLIEPLAIIQGYDTATLRYCAKQLLALGYTRFGIGSMAHLYNTEEIIKRVKVVQSIVGQNVHVFGVTAIETLKRLNEIGVASVDSSRPIKAAIYNEILYSEPYQRFGIAGSQFRARERKFGVDKMLSELFLSCPCPVCNNSVNNDLLYLGRRKYLLLRAIHNYYHVKKMIAGWPEDHESDISLQDAQRDDNKQAKMEYR